MPSGVYNRGRKSSQAPEDSSDEGEPGIVEVGAAEDSAGSDRAAEVERILAQADRVEKKVGNFEQMMESLLRCANITGIHFGQEFESRIPLRGGISCSIKLQWTDQLRRSHFDQIRKYVDMLEVAMATDMEDEAPDEESSGGQSDEGD